MAVERIAPPHTLYFGGEAVDISTTDHTFTKTARALWVGTTGDIAVETLDGSTLTFSSVSAGWFEKVVITKVLQSGTTATNLQGVW